MSPGSARVRQWSLIVPGPDAAGNLVVVEITPAKANRTLMVFQKLGGNTLYYRWDNDCVGDGTDLTAATLETVQYKSPCPMNRLTMTCPDAGGVGVSFIEGLGE